MSWLDILSGAADVASAGYNIYGAYQSGKRQDQALDAANRAQQESAAYNKDAIAYQQALAQRGLWELGATNAFNKRNVNANILLGDALRPAFDTAEIQLISALAKSPKAYMNELTGRASTDVSAAFGQQRTSDMQRFAMQGYGQGTPQYSNYLARMGAAEAMTNAGARTQAFRTAEDTAYSRQAQALNYRKGAALPQVQVQPNWNIGQQAAGLAGQMGQQAQNQWAGAAYSLSELFGNRNNTAPQQTP